MTGGASENRYLCVRYTNSVNYFYASFTKKKNKMKRGKGNKNSAEILHRGRHSQQNGKQKTSERRSETFHVCECGFVQIQMCHSLHKYHSHLA